MWRHSVTLITLALDRARHLQNGDTVIHTCIISTTVLHTIKAKMRYSNACDVTTRHIWNWRRLSGIYLFNGLAFRANSIHWRWKHYREKTRKSYFCGRRFARYHTTVVLQRARPSCGSDDQVKIAILSPAGDFKTVSSIRTSVGSWPLATLETRKKLGRVSFRQGFWDRFFSCPQ